MAGKILKELQQTKPFRHIEEEIFLNLQRAADATLQELADVLRPLGISPTQYNVLRILRGAGETGVTCKDIAARMITRDPDITRLLDRWSGVIWSPEAAQKRIGASLRFALRTAASHCWRNSMSR